MGLFSSILKVAGKVAGTVIGGPIGGEIGGAIGGAVGGAVDGKKASSDQQQTAANNLAIVNEYKGNAQAAAGILKGGFDEQLKAYQDAVTKLNALYSEQYTGDTADLQQALEVYRAGKEAGLDRYSADTRASDANFGTAASGVGTKYAGGLQGIANDYGAKLGSLGTQYGSTLGGIDTRYSGDLDAAGDQNAGTLRAADTDYAATIGAGVDDANARSDASTSRIMGRLDPFADSGLEALQGLKANIAIDPSRLTDDQNRELESARGDWLRTLAGSGLRGAGRGGVSMVMDQETKLRDELTRQNRSRSDAALQQVFGAGTQAINAQNSADSSNAQYTGNNVLRGTQQVGANHMATEGQIGSNQLGLDQRAADAGMNLGKAAADTSLALGRDAAGTARDYGKAGQDTILGLDRAAIEQFLKGDYSRAGADLTGANDVANASRDNSLRSIGLRDAAAGRTGSLIGGEAKAIGDTAMGKAGADADALTSYAKLLSGTQFQNEADRGRTLGQIGSTINSGTKDLATLIGSLMKNSGSSSGSSDFSGAYSGGNYINANDGWGEG